MKSFVIVLELLTEILYAIGILCINVIFHSISKRNNRYGIVNITDGTVHYKFL